MRARETNVPGRELTRELALGAALLVLATAVAYIPAFRAGFVWDDDFFVTRNLALRTVHVESVAWVSERKNVLSGLFYLAAALSWLRFAPPAGDPAAAPVRR